MRMKMVAAAMLGMTASIAGAGDIVSGSARMNILESGPFATPFDAPLGDAALFTTTTAPDVLYKYGWYYRTVIDQRPRILSSLMTPTKAYAGNTATFSYPNNGPGLAGAGGRFDAVLTTRLTSTSDPTQARVESSFRITNINPVAATFIVYHLLDLDLPGGAVNPGPDDSMAQQSTSPMKFRQTEASSAQYAEIVAPGADRWMLDSGSSVRNALNTTTLTNLNNLNTSYTGEGAVAVQWTLLLQPGESRTIATAFGLNMPATAPACMADFNTSGAVTVQDIFDFLTAWFSNDARADVNGVGGVTVQDVFDFLSAWFQGCP